MNFMTSIQTCFRKYATFKGRASRSEYWYFILFYMIVSIMLNLFVAFLPQTLALIALAAFLLGFTLPSLAVGVRRLHDINKSGWFMLLGFIPLINFVLLYFFVKKGTEGPNRFGESSI